ncbi:MAG: zinc ABC transporter substrate-binding protein [Atopostipes suicloacalis]|nr:zinc ABC transporter substrate-binding protein [Atopostipes suicloacalis]
MRRNNMKSLLALIAFLFLLTACSKPKEVTNSPDEPGEGKIQIVTSIFPVYEMVREVAGNQADVHLMIGSGEDAHHYEPSAKAITLVNEADAFIYSCDEMEFWASDMLKVVENDKLSIVRLADGLDLEIEEEHNHEEEDEHGHDHGSIDPHYWLNPLAMSKQIPRLITLLSEIDPEGQSNYKENGEELISQLEQLDTEFEESFSNAKERTFIVQHKAFGHLANRYHLQQRSVGGLSTEVEPNPKDLIDIINFVKENDIEVIFYQSGNTSAIAETVARETNAEISILYDLENKPEGIENADNYYIDAMYHNLKVLKKVIN